MKRSKKPSKHQSQESGSVALLTTSESPISEPDATTGHSIESRQQRAEYCTNYLETFEKSCRNWVDLAMILYEVEHDELFEPLGFASMDDWIRTHAPVSYRLCYAIKGRYKALKEANLDDSTLRLIDPEVAQWASKAKNISPAELSKPEVKEILTTMPKQKAVRALKKALPLQHIEEEFSLDCKFAESQGKAVLEGYEAFKRLKDEHASMADFIEFLVVELYMESVYERRGEKAVTVREVWNQMRPQ